MPSILPGYSYDIFITYRQKDNKYDKWVTEFVANLRKELEATFKYDVSIYFDENPHDGLLEMHNVDQSLEGKLKSLILIPIISQTYCDPASFAWKNEFLTFNKLVQDDEFGRDIKLDNGNVISRILPVRIHDLDETDKRLLASELGGPLRSIDFIYRSPGVNRPLRSNEEHADENLNYTIYRDQINKVANSVKDILNRLINRDSDNPKQVAPAVRGPLSVLQAKRFLAPRLVLSQRLKRWGLSVLAAVIMVAIAANIFSGKQSGDQVVESSTIIRAAIDLEDHPIEFIGEASLGIGRRALCISQDGQQVAFIARQGNTPKIFLRNIGDFQVREVANTEGAYNPVFSPDGKNLLYFEKSTLRRVGVDGKGLTSLAELPDPWDVTWSTTNEIFQSAYQGSGLFRIGNKVEFISSDTITASYKYRFLQQIPGTSLLLHSGSVVGIRDLNTGLETALPMSGASNARYVPTGHLVYVSGSSLMAVAFDLEAFEILSDPIEVVSGLRIEQTGAAQFDFSANGTLVFAQGIDSRVGTFAFHDLNTGVIDSLRIPLRQFGQFSLSRDGQRIAVVEFLNNSRDIFVYEVGSGKSLRLTTDGVCHYPIWHPDSKRLFYMRGADLYIMEPDKNDKPRLFMRAAQAYSFSADGNTMVIRRGQGLFKRTMQDSTLELVGENKGFGSISPKGDFISYTSTETGESHVYLEPIPSTGRRWQVSMQGGSEETRWSDDGSKLYYRCGQKWYAVPIAFGPEVQIGLGRVVLADNYINVPGFSYDIVPSSSKLLLVKGLQKESPRQIRIVHGWFEELKRLVPATK